MNPDNYFILWFRYHQQDGYMLWIENSERDYLWTDAQHRALAFKSQDKIFVLTAHLNVALEACPPQLIALDEVAAWLANPEKIPPRDALSAWNVFDDLSKSVGVLFSGNVKAPVRNRVFDLLYDAAGPWRSQQAVFWPRQERNVLRRILRQGFRLWHKHIYWADNLPAV